MGLSTLETELNKCVHCGFCLEACPTYSITRSEIHSPRGRIAAVKLGIKSEGLETCVYCRRCELACPSGVKYSEIISQVRKPNPLEKVMLKILEKPGLISMFNIIKEVKANKPLEYSDENPEIILFPGCITSVFFKETVENALNFLKRKNYKVKIINGCCGLAHEHVGERNRSKELIKNLEREFNGKIVISLSSNCTAHMRENGLNVYDFGEFLIKMDIPLPTVQSKVTVHEPCHANLLGLNKYTREVLKRMGVEVKESEEPSYECGAGGDYFIFHKDFAEKIMANKKEKVMKSGLSTVISTNPSCSIAFLKMGLKPLHLADLLNKEL
ncbi:4Fe-4S dicluster domain-containing protein [Acidianus sulfidivorans JP7]|uniref:(Fe-S)-binding protein n=1 Tax=Acidianus sulfidivorans JP7 TaxID=619593 RepID=A0A2U9IPV0_9CREN|nr:(Fe-S)-binding protein [Acidianus sulfidivorans]AWR98041.1 4Fe-4S dicluster domain-containing protein [Acidianus sulfidivorans JP7]